MSHVTTVNIEIKDIQALIAAVKEIGGEFLMGQQTYKVFQGNLKCDHAIKVAGASYEVGVVKTDKGFNLAYDFFNNHKLRETLGDKCQKLVQLYGVHKATIEAKRKGFKVVRSLLQDGSIKLSVGGMR